MSAAFARLALRATGIGLVALATFGTVAAAYAEDPTLRKAYQREFAFLEAERNSLRQRLQQVRKENEQKIAAAEKEIDTLQGQILALTTEADQMSERLYQAERQAESTGDGEDQLESTIHQMSAVLEKGDMQLAAVEKDDPAGTKKQLRVGFERAIELLQHFSGIRKEKGKFFGPEGKELQGQLIHVGRVASYGVSDEAAGALAPAGDGRLKLWPNAPSAETARKLAAGHPPESIAVFLYENLDKGVEEKKEKTATDVIQSGGIIGWVIVAGGVLALLMALLRAFFLMRSSANAGKLVENIAPLVRRHEYDAAIARCEEAEGSAGRVLKATLKHINRPRPELEDIVSESVLHETPHLDRFGSTIMVIAAVSPLLGLLGTVTGMIATFDIITEFGTGNPKLLSGGISVALVTTELGLIVAIPALLLGNLLSAWAERIKDEMDRSALHIINIAAGVRFSSRPYPLPDREPAPESDSLVPPAHGAPASG